MAIDTSPIDPIKPINALIAGRMWVQIARDKLRSMEERHYYDQEALDQIEEALEHLDSAVRSLEE